MNTVYQQVKEMAGPHIKMYKRDLYKHDRMEITGNPGIPFLHFTGDTGTSLVKFNSVDDYPVKGEMVKYLFSHAGRDHILQQKINTVDYMPKVNRQDLVLYYNGISQKVFKITQTEASEKIRDYARSIRHQWQKAA